MSQHRQLSVDPVLGLVQPPAPQPVGAMRRPGRGPVGLGQGRGEIGEECGVVGQLVDPVKRQPGGCRRDRSSTQSVGSGRGT